MESGGHTPKVFAVALAAQVRERALFDVRGDDSASLRRSAGHRLQADGRAALGGEPTDVVFANERCGGEPR